LRRRFLPAFGRGALTCGGELVKIEKSADGGCAFVGFFFCLENGDAALRRRRVPFSD
jgi:hypothetical protein